MKKFIISEEEKNHIKKLYLIESDEECPNEMYTIGAGTEKKTKKELEDKIRREKPKNAVSVQQYCGGTGKEGGKPKQSFWVSLENDKIEYERITD
jgi:hypothetical protein